MGGGISSQAQEAFLSQVAGHYHTADGVEGNVSGAPAGGEAQLHFHNGTDEVALTFSTSTEANAEGIAHATFTSAAGDVVFAVHGDNVLSVHWGDKVYNRAAPHAAAAEAAHAEAAPAEAAPAEAAPAETAPAEAAPAEAAPAEASA